MTDPLVIAEGTTDNLPVTPSELRKIRDLNDFDLVMLISEIHDHGWSAARQTAGAYAQPEGGVR